MFQYCTVYLRVLSHSVLLCLPPLVLLTARRAVMLLTGRGLVEVPPLLLLAPLVPLAAEPCHPALPVW